MKIDVHVSVEGKEEIGKLAAVFAAFEAQSEPAKSTRTRSTKATEDKPAKEDAKPAEPVKTEQANPVEAEKQFTKQQVRAKLAALAKAGKQKEVKAILNSFGVASLLEIKPENYAAIMAAAEELEG
ncbi:hypothetical protein P22_1995 [Propionispora sp. 2/2-37]|uniref:hypothetical protein n=1 Tax=Propionispora sp. 2/2-37 TaxID=1677858 RepID=UPI0006BB689A|nr:hypothetical protein [Propionispora sp. 2/2-37]CUH95909.1 hypothetical protein P22_1995 [Propionispora sp. 2/2-37]